MEGSPCTSNMVKNAVHSRIFAVLVKKIPAVW